MRNPQVLFLDELSFGLNIMIKKFMCESILEVKKEALFSIEHYLYIYCY